MTEAALPGTPGVGHHVTLRYADGVEQGVTVGPRDSVLDAALAEGVPLLHQCRSGSCSSCVAQLAEGVAVLRPGASTALLASEFAAGQRLLCVTQPQSACRFDLPYASTVGSREVEVQAFVDAVERVAENVVRLRLELADEQWLDFRPGQFLQLSVPGIGVMRSYSPATTAAALPKIELLIRLQPGGAMSQWLTERAQVDDVLSLRGPYGAFFLRDDQRRAPQLFVAGGTGLAPILSMIDGIRQGSGRKPPVLLSFGCASPATLFAQDDLALRQQWMPNLEVRISVEAGATGELWAGNPVSALSPEDVSPQTIAYLCGPPRMIEAARERLQGYGVPASQIHSELFTASH